VGENRRKAVAEHDIRNPSQQSPGQDYSGKKVHRMSFSNIRNREKEELDQKHAHSEHTECHTERFQQEKREKPVDV